MIFSTCRRVFLSLMWVVIVMQLGCLSDENVVAGQASYNSASPRPNILWLSAEDIGPHLGCYGYVDAKTPMLDQLATEGMRYENAFVVTGVCGPTRSSIITGMYPTTLGTQNMMVGGDGVDRSIKARIPSFVRCCSEYLRQAGYYCTNNFKENYGFDAPKSAWDESSDKAHWKNRTEKNQPFFAVFNYPGTHEGSLLIDDQFADVTKRLTEEQRQDPQKMSPPPYYPDKLEVKEQWARYLELITGLDYWVADHLKALEDADLEEDTIVFFYSDHGVGMPRAKRWSYDSGTHIPLIVRIPAQFRSVNQGIPGTVENELVSSVDFAPTLLNLVGLEIPEHMQGRPFLGSNLPPQREYTFSARDRIERYDINRSVRDKRYRYIRNYEPFKPYSQFMQSAEWSPIMKALRAEYEAGRLGPDAAKFMADTKPVEELYDLKIDPHELNNLANQPQYGDTIQRMRTAHILWMLETRDLGFIPEPELIRGELQYGTRYDMGLADADINKRRDLFHLVSIAGQPTLNNLARLTNSLQDDNPTVRYWGAIGLGNLGEGAAPATDFLLAATEDTSPVIRVAAARALWKLDLTEQALQVLIKQLASPLVWVRLHAAIVLDEMDEDARPAIPALQEALKDQNNKYVARVANRALNQLLGLHNWVR